MSERQRDPEAGARATTSIGRIIGICFAISVVSGLTLFGVYVLGGQTQLEGVLLMACLGGLGVGISLWGNRLLPTRLHVEPRGVLPSGPGEVDEVEDELAEETDFGRRRLLVAGLVSALGALAAALALPVFSLGPAPGRALRTTSWRSGAVLATAAGPVQADELPVGGVVTVYPNGDPSDPNAATLLIHLDPALAPEEYVAYSKICTHAGCPVGLYRSAQHTLICPCHQSQFDVLRGAQPTNGPAVRPLPQLPIRREADGSFAALSDYPEPVGPSFWDMDL